MEMKKFVEKVKSAKISQRPANMKGLKVKTTPDHTHQLIYSEKICKDCGESRETKKLGVIFHKSQSLTIFQASMLHMVFRENIRPYDYANYHKCQAGQEFIANIKEIQLR